jgi:maltose 6'-phosphate phosphatase
MSLRSTLFRSLTAVLFAAAATTGQTLSPACSDVASRRPAHLNVLTINFLYTEIQQRSLRLNRLVDFVATAAEPVDVILMQEVAGGALEKTTNVAVDLQRALAARHANYNLAYHLANGIPGLLSVGNAVLSRCNIAQTYTWFLPFVTEEPFPNLNVSVPLKREIMLARLDVPGHGRLNVYNTHLCAFCDPVAERLPQAKTALDFIRFMQILFPAPLVFGGDFNTDLNSRADQAVYAAVTGTGLVDSYSRYRASQGPSCISCCSTTEGMAGCTYNVGGNNPFATSQPFSGGPPVRIDYIFTDPRLSIVSSGVHLPPPANDYVSDHSALLTVVALP